MALLMQALLITEKEAVFVVFDPAPPETKEIRINVICLDLADLVTADAEDIIAAVDFSFESIYFENWSAKLVGSDGRSVNCGKKEGVKSILQTDREWLTFGSWVAHHLKLALKDSLGKMTFSEVNE